MDENTVVCNIKGSRTSRCAKGTIIGPNTGVYVGGLPADFEIRRKSTRDQRLKVSNEIFCFHDDCLIFLNFHYR